MRRPGLTLLALACLAVTWIAWTGAALADDEAVVATDGGLNLRARPNLNADVLAIMPNGSTIQLRGEEDSGWYPVTYKGMNGWVSGSYIRRTEPAEAPASAPGASPSVAAAVTTSSLRMRGSPDLSGSVLSVMPAGVQVDVEDSKQSQWWKVRYRGVSGFAFAEYLSPVQVSSVPFDLDLPVPYHRQFTDVFCDPADLQMWSDYNGYRIQTQQELWDWELAHNMGYTVDQWNASPYAVASAAHQAMPDRGFNHYRFDDALEATKSMAWFIANPSLSQPSIALIWRGEHYVIVRGVRADSDPYANYPRARILGVYISDPLATGRRFLGEDRFVPIEEWLANYLLPTTYLTSHTGEPGDPWQDKYVTIQADWDASAPTEAGRTLTDFQAYAASAGRP